MKADIVIRGLLVLVPLLRTAPGLLVGAAKGIVITAVASIGILSLSGFLRIFDLLIGCIALLHPLGSSLITRVQIRMIFLGQPPVSPLYLFISGIRADTQYLIRIFNHSGPPLFSCPRN